MDNSEGDVSLALFCYRLNLPPVTFTDYLTAAIKNSNIYSTAMQVVNTCDRDRENDQENEPENDRENDQEKNSDDERQDDKSPQDQADKSTDQSTEEAKSQPRQGGEAVALVQAVTSFRPQDSQLQALAARVIDKADNSPAAKLEALTRLQRARKLGLKTVELYSMLTTTMWQVEDGSPGELESAKENKRLAASLKALRQETGITASNITEKLDQVMHEALNLYPRSPHLLGLNATRELLKILPYRIKEVSKEEWQRCLSYAEQMDSVKDMQLAPNETYPPELSRCLSLNLKSYCLYALGDHKGGLKAAREAFTLVMSLAEQDQSQSEKNFAWASLADYYNFTDDFKSAEECLRKITIKDFSGESPTFRETMSAKSLEELLKRCQKKEYWIPTFPNP